VPLILAVLSALKFSRWRRVLLIAAEAASNGKLLGEYANGQGTLHPLRDCENHKNNGVFLQLIL
jgi:hypothetical protein